MKLEQRVCSRELAQKLQKLGVKQDSFFDWECKMGNWSLIWGDYHVHSYIDTADVRQYISAFTTDELGEMLPEDIDVQGVNYQLQFTNGIYSVGYQGEIDVSVFKVIHESIGLTEADARAKMLIYLLENKLI